MTKNGVYYAPERTTAPDTPATAGDWGLYFKSDGVYVIDDAGAETKISSTSAQNLTALSLAPDTTLTIATGAVTQTQVYHLIAAETGVTDDLDTITASEGETFILIQADTGDTITVKHGTGNIQLRSNADLTLTATDALLLFWDTTQWVDVGGSSGGGGASQLTDLSDVSAAAQTANFVLSAGDGATGGDYRGRALVANDIPSLAASKITSGTLTHERGGLEADVNAYDGLIRIAGGSTSNLKANLSAITGPTVSDDSSAGYGVGSLWIDTTADEVYWCADAGVGAAVWKQIGVGSGGANTALSNLAAVAVNTDIVPDLSGTHHLGSSSLPWSEVHFRRNGWNPLFDLLTIATGVVDCTGMNATQGAMTLAAETGVTDSVTSFTNAPYSGLYLLEADTGDTITLVHDGANIYTPDDGNVTLVKGEPLLVLIVSNVCWVVGFYDHTHAAADITSGTLAHERGGIEADISAIAKGDVIAGTGTGTAGLVAASGASDGDVLTLQADGSLAYETPAAGGGSIYYGTYTGDGTGSAGSGGQAITGVGFAPDMVSIGPNGAFGQSTVYIRPNTTSDGGVTAWGADGFTVSDGGTDVFPNTNAATYYFVAIKG